MVSFLSGIRVVSLSTGIAGPNAARMLANYGAEVFKVESRSGGLDAFRSYGDSPEASPRFIEVNLNTRSITLNLKRPGGGRAAEGAREQVRRGDEQLPARSDGAARPRFRCPPSHQARPDCGPHARPGLDWATRRVRDLGPDPDGVLRAHLPVEPSRPGRDRSVPRASIPITSPASWCRSS